MCIWTYVNASVHILAQNQEFCNGLVNLTRGKEPSRLLVEAVGYCKKKDRALDLGAGALSDSKYLIKQGFSVVGVDSAECFLSEVAISEGEGFEDFKSNFKAVNLPFDSFAFPEGVFDIVNAQHSLPFNPQESFNSVFRGILYCLKEGGIFVGQFFGKNDSWNKQDGKTTFHSKEEVEDLLKDFEVIKLVEAEEDSPARVGEKKHWHVFDVIAQKS